MRKHKRESINDQSSIDTIGVKLNDIYLTVN